MPLRRDDELKDPDRTCGNLEMAFSGDGHPQALSPGGTEGLVPNGRPMPVTEGSVSRDHVCTLKSHSGGEERQSTELPRSELGQPQGPWWQGGHPQSAPWAQSKLSRWG